MLPSMFQSSTVPLLEQTVQFTESRHNVLAANIANMDTPGYRARDISPEEFQSSLRELVAAQNHADGSIAATQPALQQVREASKNILYHDDSNVSLEQQASEISKNQMQHNLALSLLSSQFRLMQAAISEKV